MICGYITSRSLADFPIALLAITAAELCPTAQAETRNPSRDIVPSGVVDIPKAIVLPQVRDLASAEKSNSLAKGKSASCTDSASRRGEYSFEEGELAIAFIRLPWPLPQPL